MNRLKIFEKLTEKEKNLQEFKNALEDVENHYFTDGEVNFSFNSRNFNAKYDGDVYIPFNKGNLSSYLESEIKTLEEEIQTLLEKLKE